MHERSEEIRLGDDPDKKTAVEISHTDELVAADGRPSRISRSVMMPISFVPSVTGR
jgi:hypothetical protein